MRVFGLGEVRVVQVPLEPAPERRHHPHEPCSGKEVCAQVVVALLLALLRRNLLGIAVIFATNHFYSYKKKTD